MHYNTVDDVPEGLARIFWAAAPKNDQGNKSFRALARALGCSHQLINKCILQQKISPRLAMAVVRYTKGRVARKDFKPYIAVDDDLTDFLSRKA